MTELTSPRASFVEDSFETDDIATAEKIVRRLYPVARMQDPQKRFWFEQTTRGSNGVTFARFKISSKVDIAVEFEQVAAFGLVLGGDYTATTRGETLDTTRPFLFRPGLGGSSSEALDLLMVNIDLPTLTTAAAARLGGDGEHLALRSTSPVSDAMRRYWTRTIGYAWTSIVDDPEVFRNELIRATTFEAVVAAAIAAFPLDVLRSGRAGHEGPPSRTVRTAREYIEQHVAEPLTVDLIARHANVSVRALQKAFRSELDTTPLGHLRRIRLTRAREELRDGDPRTLSVAAVARRWGFVNAGRFAADYAELFGEKPSVTLRR